MSIDGEGRRDHQQDMDIRLSAAIKGPHSAKADLVVKVMDGRQGDKQHAFNIYNLDGSMRSWGLSPDKCQWAPKKGGDAAKEGDWDAIWPWEKASFEKQGRTVAIGAPAWKNSE